VGKQLDRKLGFWSVYSISVGAMLGSGICVLPILATGIAGPWVSVSYLLAGILVLPALASKAELATAMPVAGGTYVYVDRAMGPLAGTITGIGTWLSLSSKTAFAVVGVAAYLSLFADPSIIRPVSLGILVLLVIVNLVGVGKASALQALAVGICVFALALYALAGIPAVDEQLFDPALPNGLQGIAGGAAFLFVAYAGVTKICSLAEEVRHPERNIPRGMLAAHVTVAALYAVISTIIAGTVSQETNEKCANAAAAKDLVECVTPLAQSGLAIGGQKWLIVMAIVSILGLLATCNAGVMSASRYPFAMARDRLLPDKLKELSPRFHTPSAAIILTGVGLLILVTSLPVVQLAKIASAFKIAVFAVVNLAVILLRESHAKWYRPRFLSPYYPWLQILGIIGGLWLLTQLGFKPLAGLLGTVLIGTAWYFLYVKKRVNRRSLLSHLWGEARLLRDTRRAELEEERTYQPPRVIVPLFGGEQNAARLMRLGSHFVDGGWLEVIRLEELPEQTMLAGFLSEDEEMQRLAEQSERIGSELHVRVEFHDVLTHNAKGAVQEHATKTRAEWLIMNWPEAHGLASLVQNPMAWWLDHSPCDLALFLDRSEASWQRILVLAQPGPYDSLLLHVADRLATEENGTLTLLGLVDEDADSSKTEAVAEYHRELDQMTRNESQSRIIPSSDKQATIRELTAQYDVMLIGAQPEHSIRTIFLGSPEHRLAEAAVCSTLMVKAPRDSVHNRFPIPNDVEFLYQTLQPTIASAALGLQVQVNRKDDLLDLMASRLAHVTGLEIPAEIATRLREREARQTTQLQGGVALVGATKGQVPTTTLGVFTLRQPLPWGGTSLEPVDICLVVLSPPGERQAQLFMLGRLARMVLMDGFLQNLRDARSEEALLEVLRHADGHIDDHLGVTGATSNPEGLAVVLETDELAALQEETGELPSFEPDQIGSDEATPGDDQEEDSDEDPEGN